MATGDFTVFEEFSLDLGSGVHDLSSDTFKIAFIDNTTPPTAADATPRWADYSANEVSGTGYTAGGQAVDNVSYTEADGVATFDFDDEVFSQNGAGPTDIYWGILYNDTAASDQAVGFIEMGGPVSMVAGDVTCAPNASGVLTVTVS